MMDSNATPPRPDVVDPESKESWVGKVLGCYRLIDELASGGQATVYRARDERSGRIVALKVLPTAVTHKPEYLKRFRREYLTMADLDHPNLLRLIEYAEVDGVLFYAMPFVEYPTLDGLLRPGPDSDGRLPVPRAVRIGVELLKALSYIHERGIIHRDLKPANLFVGPDDHVVLADFGLAKVIRQTAITMGPTFLGTIEYASPEQIDVTKTLDHRSDLYQAGLVVYHSLVGKPRRERRPNIEAVIAQKCFEEGVASVRTLRPEVPELLDAVLLRATRTEPAERWPSADEMRVALEGVMAVLPA